MGWRSLNVGVIIAIGAIYGVYLAILATFDVAVIVVATIDDNHSGGISGSGDPISGSSGGVDNVGSLGKFFKYVTKNSLEPLV